MIGKKMEINWQDLPCQVSHSHDTRKEENYGRKD